MAACFRAALTVILKGELGRDVRVEARLERQRDAHADRTAAGHLRGTAVGRLHEARPAARAHEQVRRLRRARVRVVGVGVVRQILVAAVEHRRLGEGRHGARAARRL
eukprot:73031-Prymnesium_polylepis.1